MRDKAKKDVLRDLSVIYVRHRTVWIGINPLTYFISHLAYTSDILCNFFLALYCIVR